MVAFFHQLCRGGIFICRRDFLWGDWAGTCHCRAVFLYISALAAPAGARFAVLDAMQPLQPIMPRLLIAIISAVILMSAVTGLTALLAVVTTMPHVMCGADVRRPQTARQIVKTFWSLQKGSGDELVIISASMVIASLAADTPFFGGFAGWLVWSAASDMADDMGAACIGVAGLYFWVCIR